MQAQGYSSIPDYPVCNPALLRSESMAQGLSQETEVN